MQVSLEPKSKKNYISLPKVDIFDAHNFHLDLELDENQVRIFYFQICFIQQKESTLLRVCPA